MTIVLTSEARIKSRLLVALEAIDAPPQYRVYALAVPGVLVPVTRPAVHPNLPATVPAALPGFGQTAGGSVQATPEVSTPVQGLLRTLVRSARLALRSPRAALPIILVWALLAIGP